MPAGVGVVTAASVVFSSGGERNTGQQDARGVCRHGSREHEYQHLGQGTTQELKERTGDLLCVHLPYCK